MPFLRGFAIALVIVLAPAMPAVAGWDEAIAAFERGDFETALKEFQILADEGDPDGQVGLGAIYGGGFGVAQDYGEAARWFRLAADQGSAAAQYELGDLYYNGLGVAEDFAEAALWFERAARQGYVEAQESIALQYGLGEGVEFDPVKAYAWFALAAAGMSEHGPEGVRLMAEAMSEAEIAEAVALAESWIGEQYAGTTMWDAPALDVSAPLGAPGNPVRVDGPGGEHAYLDRLRCPNGEAPDFERLGSVGEGPYGRIMDIYELRCELGGHTVDVYMAMYHPDEPVHFPVPGFTFADSQAS